MAWAMVASAAVAVVGGVLSKNSADKASDQATYDRQNEMDLQNRQLAIAERQDSRASELFDHYKTTFMPRETQLVNDAFGNEISPARAEARATGDVRSALATARDSSTRRLRALGVDPGSGAALALNGQTGLDEARVEAGSRTAAREGTRDKNFQRQATVLGYANPSGANGYANSAMAGVSGAETLASRRSAGSAAASSVASENYAASLGDLMDTGLSAWKNRQKKSSGNAPSNVDPYDVGWF